MPTMTKTALAGLFVLLPAAFTPIQGAGAAEGAPPVWAADPPAAFVPPPLHPAEIELKTRELAPGVHALLSGHPAVDNSGFVVGERGVLVMDRTTLTRNLKPLLKDGLIESVPGEDRRGRVISLTGPGRAALMAGLSLWEEAHANMIGALGRERWEGFLNDLSAVVEIGQEG